MDSFYAALVAQLATIASAIVPAVLVLARIYAWRADRADRKEMAKLQARAVTEEQRRALDPSSLPEIPRSLQALAVLALAGSLVAAAATAKHHRAQAVARSASEPSPPTQPKPPSKNCDGGCGAGCRCVGGQCQCQAEDRKPKRVDNGRQSGPVSSHDRPGWEDCCPSPFDRAMPAL